MLNEHMQALGDEPSAIRELFAYGQARKAEIGANKVFDFSIGNPSVPTPDRVTELLLEGAQQPSAKIHAYTPAPGNASTRTAIADSLNRRFDTSYGPESLYLTCGAAASISISLKAVIEEGDEVVVITPYFPEYAVWVRVHGAMLVEVPARQQDFQPDIEALEAAINEHTKAVIINTPNNPVGVIYTPEALNQLANLLRTKSTEYGRPIFLLSDEPYRELAFGPVAPAWVPAVYEYTIVCYSWSKSLSLPGERIGYILVPDTMPEAGRVMAAVAGAGRALGFVCAPALFQYMIERCPDLVVDKQAYIDNRVRICKVMDEAGLEYINPDGAFYLWVRALEPDAKAFSERAKAHELLLVPSDSFGVQGWVRLGYCVSPETIEGSLDAFQALRAEYE